MLPIIFSLNFFIQLPIFLYFTHYFLQPIVILSLERLRTLYLNLKVILVFLWTCEISSQDLIKFLVFQLSKVHFLIYLFVDRFNFRLRFVTTLLVFSKLGRDFMCNLYLWIFYFWKIHFYKRNK